MNIHVSELADLMRYVQPYGSKLKTPCAPDDPGLMPLSIRTDLFLIYPKMTTFFFISLDLSLKIFTCTREFIKVVLASRWSIFRHIGQVKILINEFHCQP